MKEIVLALAIGGLASLVIGIVMIGSTLGARIIPSSGCIAHPHGESESEEANTSLHFDEKGYIPTFAGLGLLSVAFILWKKRK